MRAKLDPSTAEHKLKMFMAPRCSLIVARQLHKTTSAEMSHSTHQSRFQKRRPIISANVKPT